MIYHFEKYTDRKGKERLKSSGVTFGYGDSNPYVIEETEEFFIVRHPAVRDWSGRGQTSSYPASIALYQKTGVDSFNRETQKEVGEWEYTREAGTRKAAMEAARTKMNEIQKNEVKL